MTVMASQTTISGAIIAQGMLVAENGNAPVQHPSGGTVNALLVREGDAVVAGQVLLRLDDTVERTRVHTIAVALLRYKALMIRLEAEQAGLAPPDFSVLTRPVAMNNREFLDCVEAERQQFELREGAKAGQLDLLSEQMTQIEDQLAGQSAQLDALVIERGQLEVEATRLRGLFEASLVSHSRLYDTELSLTRVRGLEGSLRAEMAANRSRLTELDLSATQLERDRRVELGNQLADTQRGIAELSYNLDIASNALTLTTVVAPRSGIVHELAIKSKGTVIRPAEVLMNIVEADARLLGRVPIRPSDVDQVYPGQPVSIQFSAFDRGTTPAVAGTLKSVSADLEEDPRQGSPFYAVTVTTETETPSTVEGMRLLPGMPIEVFIKTSDRTLLSYLTKQIADQFNRALR